MAETYKQLFKRSGFPEGTINNVLKACGLDANSEVNAGDSNRVLKCADTYIKGEDPEDEIDKALISMVNNFKADVQEDDIVKTFQDVPLEELKFRVAEYNNRHGGTKLTVDDVTNALEGARRLGYQEILSDDDRKKAKASLDSFLVANGPEHYEEIKERADWNNSLPHQLLRKGSYVVDMASGFVPGPWGIPAAALGPGMRAYDEYRSTGDVDVQGALQDLAFNEAGQWLGGKLSKPTGKVLDWAGNKTGNQFFKNAALTFDAAGETGKVAKALWDKPIKPVDYVNQVLAEIDPVWKSGTPELKEAVAKAKSLKETLQANMEAARRAGDIGTEANYREALNLLDEKIPEAAKQELSHKRDFYNQWDDIKARANTIADEDEAARKVANKLNQQNKDVKEAFDISGWNSPVSKPRSYIPSVIAAADDAGTKFATDAFNGVLDKDDYNPFKEVQEIAMQYADKKKQAKTEQEKNEADIKANDAKYKSLPPIERKPEEPLEDKYKRWALGYITVDEAKSPEFKQFKMDALTGILPWAK